MCLQHYELHKTSKKHLYTLLLQKKHLLFLLFLLVGCPRRYYCMYNNFLKPDILWCRSIIFRLYFINRFSKNTKQNMQAYSLDQTFKSWMFLLNLFDKCKVELKISDSKFTVVNVWNLTFLGKGYTLMTLMYNPKRAI